MTFHSVGNFIIPADELHHFSEGLVETTNQFHVGSAPLQISGFMISLLASLASFVPGCQRGVLKHGWNIHYSLRGFPI